MPVRRALLPLVALLALAPAAGAHGASAPACPPRDRHAPLSARTGAGGALVAGRPSAVLLCRYRGVNPSSTAFRLAARRLVTAPAAVGSLRSALDALTPTHRALPCPLATGAAVIAWFRYRSGPPDPVAIGLDGCMNVTNGHVHRVAGVQAPGRRAVAAVKRLTP